MVVIAAGRSESVQQGIEPFSARHHLQAMADLVAEVFANELDANGRSALEEMQALGRLNSLVGALLSTAFFSDFVRGYVWFEENRLVGNVTLQRADSLGSRWRISNVAVASAHRGHGIARTLLLAATLREIALQGGNWAVLQVRTNNLVARHLYEGLGFTPVCQDGAWELPAMEVPVLAPDPGIALQPLNARCWRERLDLGYVAQSSLAQWAEPVQPAKYRPGITVALQAAFGELIGLQRTRRWGAWQDERLMGEVEVLINQIGDAHQLRFTVRPEARGRLETTLLAQGLWALANAAPHRIVVEHSGDHVEGVAALEAAGFRRGVVLQTMRRLITPADIHLPVPERLLDDPGMA